MKVFLAAVAVVVSAPALAQIEVEIEAPKIRFAVAPAVVVVAPGVQVVPDYDEEVFFVSRAYWVRRGPHWYRSNGHHGRWVRVKPGAVPRSLVKIPHGKYRRYKPNRGHDRDGHHGAHHRRGDDDRDGHRGAHHRRGDDDRDGHRGAHHRRGDDDRGHDKHQRSKEKRSRQGKSKGRD